MTATAASVGASVRQPIRTLLVANRGEIACRVLRTARAMGLRTVAVYSDPDARAPHVALADRAVPLGGAAAADSYLDQDKMLAAAVRSDADAVHPGYGFLSENAAFATACAEKGLLFVGPSPEAIREMGLKDRAKAIAHSAGVPVLTDAQIVGDDVQGWREAAESVGYPLLVKATAGGGGKGMRLVSSSSELADAVVGAQREAVSSFGAGEVFLERYLHSPRHIEIQVFGDSYGSAVHLLERECSVQRRHQKVVEEAPSPAVDEDLRARMGAAAVALVRHIRYVGAGTVEFLVDDAPCEPQFYFLEMNTRLQVEHPVTEEVTGLDLVRMQLEVARGDRLPVAQAEISPRGHAIEVRLYAEDPARDFLPTPGPLHHYSHPSAAGLRYEDGLVAPSEVSAHYDPMLAKVVAHAGTRTEAAARLAAALAAMQIHGLTTNRDFLVALLRESDFLAGETRTDYLPLHPDLLTAGCPTPVPVHLAAAVAVLAARRRAEDRVTGHAPPGWRLLPGSPLTRASWSRVGPASDPFELAYQLSAGSGDATLVLHVDGQRHLLDLHELGPQGVRVLFHGVETRCEVRTHPDGSVWVNDFHGQTGWLAHPRLPEAAGATAAGGLVAELPGTVVAVRVAAGDRVAAGQQLVVTEAMKMEHATVAPGDAVVESVHVEVGQYVDAQTVLVTLTEDAG